MAARKSPLDVYANVGKQIKEGRHVGLDFYDLLIEAIGGQKSGHGIAWALHHYNLDVENRIMQPRWARSATTTQSLRSKS
jgi:hypothetical protein